MSALPPPAGTDDPLSVYFDVVKAVEARRPSPAAVSSHNEF
jgi:hypothetical protein